MGRLTEEEALARLAAGTQVTYEDLDDVFGAYGFTSDFEAPNVTWYFHPRYDCGYFRAEPRYEFSVLSEAQKSIVRRMIQRLRDLRELHEDN